MPFSQPYTPSVTSDLPSTTGLLATFLEFWISSGVMVGYITAFTLFLAYNTFYKAIDMSALYALTYVEALNIPIAFGAVVAMGTGLASLGSVAAKGFTNIGGGVANVGWIVGGVIGRVMAPPEDLICSLMFKRQCPQTAGFVERLGRSSAEEKEREEKKPFLEEGDELV